MRKSENAPAVRLLVHIDTVNLIRKYLLNEVHQNVNATSVQSIILSIRRFLGTFGRSVQSIALNDIKRHNRCGNHYSFFNKGITYLPFSFFYQPFGMQAG